MFGVKKISYIFCMLFLVGLMTACGKKDKQNVISEAINIDVEKGKIISEYDTHGGAHGDGTSCIVLKFNNDSILKEIKSNKKWKSFPMNETVKCLAYGEEIENCTVGPYLTDEKSGDRLLPNIQRGYYLLIDRQNQNNQSKKENILDKPSFNYDLGIYDMDTNTLYFCQLDT